VGCGPLFLPWYTESQEQELRLRLPDPFKHFWFLLAREETVVFTNDPQSGKGGTHGLGSPCRYSRLTAQEKNPPPFPRSGSQSGFHELDARHPLCHRPPQNAARPNHSDPIWYHQISPAKYLCQQLVDGGGHDHLWIAGYH
jgi:hypothetical protein